jgi:hypothetical protein
MATDHYLIAQYLNYGRLPPTTRACTGTITALTISLARGRHVI